MVPQYLTVKGEDHDNSLLLTKDRKVSSYVNYVKVLLLDA